MMFLLDDVRAAWRGLRNSPGFLALSAGVLALGLGATIFMYGVINTTLLAPPPVPNADRIVGVFGSEPARNFHYDNLPYLDYLEYKQEQRSFENLAAYYTGTMIISGEGVPERYSGGFVTHDFVDVFGVKPFLGRDFNEADDVPNAAPVALLSYDVWRTRFNRDPEIVGKIIRIGSVPTTVVGVMPPGFNFPSAEALWIPMARDPSTEVRGYNASTSIHVNLVGRLKPDVTRDEAARELAGIAERLAKQYPRTNTGKTVNVVSFAEIPIQDPTMLYAMFAAVWLVLLIACANVASLIFVRANFRVYEASMRVALGARRPRLITQMLAESVLVALIGLVGALALAALALHWVYRMVHSAPEFPAPAWWSFSIDFGVAAFAGVAALFAGLLSGIVPAIRASRPDVMRILRDGGRTGTGLRLSKFTTTMVIMQIALSAALLTGAGLMTRTAFLSLQRDHGADVRGFMSARVGLPPAYSDPERQARFFEQLVADLSQRPGVLAATAATSMPATGTPSILIALDGRSYQSRSDYPTAQEVVIVPGFFDAFSRTLLQGRDFNSGDRLDSPQVVIVNEAFVERHFGGENPLGRRVQLDPEEHTAEWATIIGVAPNINHSMEWEEGGGFRPTIYRSILQKPWRFMTVAIRTEGDPLAYGDVLRQATQKLDPDLAVYWLMTLEQYQVQARYGMRLLSQIFLVFAGLAIVLAGVGIYGVLAFATGQRNREIGIRRALGARDGQILLAVMRGAAVQLAIGLGLGAILAALVARGMSPALNGLPADDPVIYGVVFGVLILAAVVASWIPAKRALRVQPAVALRYE